jgi:hypothetical protein
MKRIRRSAVSALVAAVVLIGPNAFASPRDGGPGDGGGVVRKIIRIVKLMIGVNDDSNLLSPPHP